MLDIYEVDKLGLVFVAGAGLLAHLYQHAISSR